MKLKPPYSTQTTHPSSRWLLSHTLRSNGGQDIFSFQRRSLSVLTVPEGRYLQFSAKLDNLMGESLATWRPDPIRIRDSSSKAAQQRLKERELIPDESGYFSYSLNT